MVKKSGDGMNVESYQMLTTECQLQLELGLE